jgi:D-beta-D-heptose 7-phosphate kinase/D-beta-D-heptose 1-phosphate adenosyltransferase
MYRQLLNTVRDLKKQSVLVVGDLMLDSYIYGDALRISPEAPVPVLKVMKKKYCPGGAGSVAADVAALGGKCFCIGTVGKDEPGKMLLKLLEENNIETNGIVETAERITTCKQRLVGLAQHKHRQQLIRIDEEDPQPVSNTLEDKIIGACEKVIPNVDAICIEDYNKGIITEKLCKRIIKIAHNSGIKVLIDPSNCNFDKYCGANVITPNRREAENICGFKVDSPKAAEKAADIIGKKYDIEAVVITLDKEGAMLRINEKAQLVPTTPRSVYDVSGAGDVVLAMLAVAIAGQCDYQTAVRLANIAGGLEVEKFGTATVTMNEIMTDLLIKDKHSTESKVMDRETLLQTLEVHRQNNDTIVFTNGCFDVLHRGHIEYLKFCKMQGDIVVLGLNSDSSVKMQNKGPDRPINNQDDRAALLSTMEMIDYIVIYDEQTPQGLIEQVRPNILIKGKDWENKGVVGREFVESIGGKVVLADLIKGKSSTDTIKKMQKLQQTGE